MSEKQVDVAMIGLGFGAEFIPIYQAHPHANVAAICRRNEAELNNVGDALGIEKRCPKYEDVLADANVDFVHINSPIPDHAWMSIAALKAGKHVMCTVSAALDIRSESSCNCSEIGVLACRSVISWMIDIAVFRAERTTS